MKRINMVDISVVIVNFNTGNLLSEMLQSLFKTSSGCTFEIFVVDNASSDNSVALAESKELPVTYLKNDRNVGFSRANNQAIRLTSGRYILLLNPDVLIESDTLPKMVRFMDMNAGIGASGCKVLLPDGSLDKACKRGFPTLTNAVYKFIGVDRLFPKSKKFAGYNLNYLSDNEPNEVDCLVGAFMMVRRETLVDVGVLDEQFFMYGEDIDWCYRIKEAGWSIWYYPYATVLHCKRTSSQQVRLFSLYHFYNAMKLFYNKHYMYKHSHFLNFIVFRGISILYFIAVAKAISYRTLMKVSHSFKIRFK